MMTFVGGECVFDRAAESRKMIIGAVIIAWPGRAANALALGYLLGSIPFGLIFTRLGRGRRAQDRLGQYRRDQCAAHRQEMGGGR